MNNMLVLGVLVRRRKLQNFLYVGLACLAVIDIFVFLEDILTYCVSSRGSTPPCALSYTFSSLYTTLTALVITAMAVYIFKNEFKLLAEKDLTTSLSVMLLSLSSSVLICLPTIFIYPKPERNALSCSFLGPSGLILFYIAILPAFNFISCSIVIIFCLLHSTKHRKRHEGKKEREFRNFENMVSILWLVFVLVGVACELPHYVNLYNFYIVRSRTLFYALCTYKLYLYLLMDPGFIIKSGKNNYGLC